MLIVAHPDDEDGGLLTYLSRGQGARVAMLTLTRGEGGQNLMSADFDDALGLIRTQELLAADRYMGVDQFFGTEVDFGFSKTKEESFAKWTHDRVLYDAVRAVRLYRPLVIASVFIGAPSDGHGHHQVSGQIAQEVFNAAGDPTVFPDQIAAGLQPWQPLKVYARVPFARIDDHGMFDYATNQYVPARFTNYVTGKVTTTIPKANVVVPEGAPATYTAADGTQTPIPGMDGLTYIQFARKGLALEKSQIGPNVRLAPPGRADVSYHRYGSRVLAPNGKPQPDGDDSGVESSVFEGIDTSLVGIADLAPDAPAPVRGFLQYIDAKIAEAQRLFNPDHLELTAPPLREALIFLDHTIEGAETSTLPPEQKYNLLHELRIKRVQLNNALILAYGITLEAVLEPTLQSKQHPIFTEPEPTTANVTQGSTIYILAKLNNGALDIRKKVSDPTAPPHTDIVTEIPKYLGQGLTPILDAKHNYYGNPPPPTRPYFSRSSIELPFYDLTNQNLRNAPQTPPAAVVHSSLDDNGVEIEIDAVVSAATRLPSGQLFRQPLSILPPVSISLDRSVAIIRPDEKFVPINARVSSQDSIQNLGGVKVFLSNDPTSQGKLIETAFPGEFSKVTGKDEFIGLSVDSDKLNGKPAKLTAVITQNQHDYSEGYRAVGYPGLTYTNYYTPATTRVVPVDVTTAPNLNIAYLPGTGDNVAASLEDLGIHAHLITPADLTAEKLKPYDAVVLGVRAYEAHPELAAANAALNTYAAAGGVVIAQYNTGRLPDATGPYPLDLGPSEKVVEETAPVRILAPSDPLLNWPNRITPADFDHWVEERGHGFMSTWDSHYTALLETHDTGQKPQLGGLLYARTGRALWIYLGLALYRQLPEGVPGSYRLFANLLSAAKNPALQSSQN
jgi:LmbE family N-acetylglucosaminyl deacetylase